MHHSHLRSSYHKWPSFEKLLFNSILFSPAHILSLFQLSLFTHLNASDNITLCNTLVPINLLIRNILKLFLSTIGYFPLFQ
ncbi:unnamed protein product [Brassica oleracea]